VSKKDKLKIAQHWGQTPPDVSKTFYGFPPIRDYLFTCISGRVEKTERNWCERWTIETYLSDDIPLEECLSLCCGFGEIERMLADLGVFLHCTAIDLSPAAVEVARQKAKEAGHNHIDYHVVDLNNIRLEPQKYDLVYANGALHHLSRLEHVIGQIYTALKPGGILVSNEYIGPKYQRLSWRQREIINSVIHLIPIKYRAITEETYVPVSFRYPIWKRGIFELYRLLTLQDSGIDVSALKPDANWPNHKIWLLNLFKLIRKIMPVRKRKPFRYGKVWDEMSELTKATDPSECVRSDEIIPIMQKHFKDIDIKYYNGSVLFYALDRKFYETYDHDQKEDRALLDLLIKIEKTMIDIGELESDHAHIIARKELQTKKPGPEGQVFDVK